MRKFLLILAIISFALPIRAQVYKKVVPPEEITGSITIQGPNPWIDVTAAPYNADSSGSSDSQAAIQAAIDALPSTGGTVYFPPGSYKINTPIVCDPALGGEIRLIGNGLTTTIVPGSTSQHGIRIISDKCEVKDLTIDAPASYAKSAIRIEDGVTNTLIYRVRIAGDDYTTGSKGIEFVSSSATGITFNHIEDCTIEALEHSIEMNQAVTGSYINGNYIIGNTFLNPGTAIYMTGFATENATDGNVIANNQVQTNADLVEGFRIDGNWNILSGNMFWDLQLSGNKGINVLSTASFTQITGGYIQYADITNSGTSTQFLGGDKNLFGGPLLGPSATLEVRDSTNPQALRVYNTYTSGTNFESGDFLWSSNVLRIGTNKGSSGTARDIHFIHGGTIEWSLRTDGLVPGNDNVNNLGSAALRTTSLFSYILDLKPQASPPGTPTSGMIYVDSTATPDELCFYDGAAWQGISSGTDGNCQ